MAMRIVVTRCVGNTVKWRKDEMEDEADIKIPRAPLGRYEYGLIAVCVFGVTALLMLVAGLLFG